MFNGGKVSNWWVPVNGSAFMTKEATHLKPLRPAFCDKHSFSSY
jgi:hypothetical protein